MKYSDLPELMEIIDEIYGFSLWGDQDEVWERLVCWFEGIDYLSSDGDLYAIAEEAISSSYFAL